MLAQLPEIVRRIDHLDAVIIQPSAEPGSVSLFRFQNAQRHGPGRFSESSAIMKPLFRRACRFKAQALNPWNRESNKPFRLSLCEFILTAMQIEHLAMLKRWYDRSHRVGEIFFADDKGSWPLRRMVRGIGRVYKGEESAIPGALPLTETSSPS